MALNQAAGDDEEKRSEGLGFNPPVYKQRYNAVIALARQLLPKMVIDMGCGECKLVRQLKSEQYVEQLIGVDIDRSSLEDNEYWIKPLITDFIYKRLRPLHICLMQGSIDDPDERIQDCDLLAFIEVIEHLYPETLEKVPYALFRAIRPKVAIVSTPNADFNVLFGSSFKGFRHYDHKFEWTRSQFQNWCFQVCVAYGYTVEFSGVGDPPISEMNLGHCSQIAVFRLINQSQQTVNLDTPFQIVSECCHPYEENPLSRSEKLCREAEYYLRVLLKRRLAEEGEENTTMNIRLNDLLVFPQIKRLCSSVLDIEFALSTHSSTVLSADKSSALLDVTEQYYTTSESDSDDDEQYDPEHCTTSMPEEASTTYKTVLLPTESWD